jgi:stage V sporulation protein AE
MAFLVGGAICAVAQIIMDATKIPPAIILVSYVTAGTFLTAVGIYGKIVEIGGAGATIPLTGFGYTLARGVVKAVNEKGFWGIFSGGAEATAMGVAAAVIFGYAVALIFNPKG